MAYNYDAVLKLLQIMDLAVQWPDLKPISDAAYGDLRAMMAAQNQPKATPAPPIVRAEPIKPTAQVGNTETPIKRLGGDNG